MGYYHTVVSWLERLKCGITSGELYQTVENVLPKERWHWHLNPNDFPITHTVCGERF
ncbi:hypothetical protein [Pantoea sp.]|uniref:hypothetical protein n=1 Tax=Pantoea sp. TaxID=69393 RepID=UPI0039E23DA5